MREQLHRVTSVNYPETNSCDFSTAYQHFHREEFSNRFQQQRVQRVWLKAEVRKIRNTSNCPFRKLITVNNQLLNS